MPLNRTRFFATLYKAAKSEIDQHDYDEINPYVQDNVIFRDEYCHYGLAQCDL